MVPGKSLNGDLCKESITHVTSCRYILQMDFVGLLRTCWKRESGFTTHGEIDTTVNSLEMAKKLCYAKSRRCGQNLINMGQWNTNQRKTMNVQ